MKRLTVSFAIAAVAILSAAYLWRDEGAGRAPPREPAATVPSAPTAAVPAAPETGGERVVFGRVVRAGSGEPVAGAALELIPLWAEGATDDDGRFEIRTGGGDVLRCAVKAPGLRAALGPWLRFGDISRLDAGTIRLVPGSRIAGRVVGADGGGVAGAWIDLEREGPLSEEWEAILGPFGTAEADGEGRFVFEGLDDGLFRITASAADPASGDDIRRTIEHVRPGGEEVLIAFPVSVRPVRGTIAVLVTLPDGRPLPRGDLHAGAADATTRETIRDGWASVVVEGVRPAWLAVLDPRDGEGNSLPYRPAFRMDVAPREEPYPVALEPGETIEGQVVTTAGSPLPAVRLRLWPRDAEGGLARFIAVGLGAESGPDGRFRAEGLVPGEYGLQPACPGFSPVRPWTLARTGATDVSIEMRRAGRIVLRAIAPEGDLLGGGSFTLYRRGSETEPSNTTISVGGRSQLTFVDATFDGLVEGEIYRVRGSVSRRGFGRYAPIDVDALAGDGTPLEVDLRPGRTLRGRVVRTDGRTIVDAEVRARVPRPPGTDEHAHYGTDRGQPGARSGLDGRFDLHGVPDGAFWLTCAAPGLAQAGGPLRVEPQETEVEIRMAPALEITGRVSGEGPLDFRIDWIPADWEGEALRVPRDFDYAGADGFFALRDLPPGTMRLDGWRPWADEDDRYVQAEGVRAGATELRLAVQEGGRITGTLKDREGRPVAGASIAVEAPWGARAATTDEEGRFVLRALPPGRHALLVDGLSAPVLADAPGPPVHLGR